jgi:hypothetical protein
MPRKVNKDFIDSRKKPSLRKPGRSIPEKKWISFSNDLVKTNSNLLKNYLNAFNSKKSSKTLFQNAVDGASVLTNFKRNALKAGISEEKLMHVTNLIQEYKKLIKLMKRN